MAEPTNSPPAGSSSLLSTDVLTPVSLKPAWMTGSGTSSTLGAALAKPPPKSEEGLGADEVSSFGICEKGRYGYKGRHGGGYGQRSYAEKRSGGKRSGRDRREHYNAKDSTRDPTKEKWERGRTSPRDKDHSRRDRDRGRDIASRQSGGGSTKSRQRSPRYDNHSVSPRKGGSDPNIHEPLRRGSLPNVNAAQPTHGAGSLTIAALTSPRESDESCDPALERARALVPSQPTKKSSSKQRQRNDKRTGDHYYPSRPPAIKVDAHSIQPLALLTSPRYARTGLSGSGVSPRSLSPSPSPRGCSSGEETKATVQSGSRKARTSFFQSLKQREASVQGGRAQLSMRSADDVFLAGNVKTSPTARRLQPRAQASKPRGAMARGRVGGGAASPSPSGRAGARTGSNESIGSGRSVGSSDSDSSRLLISEDEEEEEQRFLKEMGWSKDEVQDADDWQLTPEEIEHTRKQMVDQKLSLDTNLPLSRMQYLQQFQKKMPASVATASSPALLRFATRKHTSPD
eukprot:CAMPEP_0114626718 /NCGR_PEP_ID=MMETSP0168-20121206/11929_1 /TAXON_ID=95228 ORGANISM="Vannella sp., Strain DIVA3 517/6/12" /NCGR_SAMPLE_ID=MMETSP0168 /ASSEMBLY_ACC=CAM_ASM_000044 /LENGTH=513 /DNA_ID=CAMNT_0001838037 /DNA_START=210 /DNA_END=1748 /DNA_ORIENTATION=+